MTPRRNQRDVVVAVAAVGAAVGGDAGTAVAAAGFVGSVLSRALKRPRSAAGTSPQGDRARLPVRELSQVTVRRLRRLAQACRAADPLVDYLLTRAVHQLPASYQDRYAEEWSDHRHHLRGLRLLWWALCVRVTDP
ncbi:hypothetical protein [Candidatus Protofrankia californiensis]|uniref:hypothetical protein n=1 Tax=Candidatus Protofrankia californiensis TaxID=1839754 RepID=UPI0010414239|nr:hypothetical protein [Candidatus Protofrankia californiensis]